ncbi:Carnosine N-methyltransferase 1 [Botrytis cinerea]
MAEHNNAWEGNEETQNDPDEKRVLHQALDSFYHYQKTAHYNTTHLRRQAFYALPRAHWELLASPPINYLDTLIAVDDAIDQNAELSEAILSAALPSFNLPYPSSNFNPSTKSPDDFRGTATTGDLEKARSTLRQMYRDWSAEGAVEREASYRPILSLKRNMRVLVPGAGLGRLVFDLCMQGFDVEGNEISYHQLLSSAYILNFCPQKENHTIFPWIHSFSNHKTRSNHLRSVKIPDVHPGNALNSNPQAGEMTMSASDFLLLYGDEERAESFDAVAAVFFLDTAPNIIRYLEAIRNCLKPGGILINMGPLLWHFENNPPGSSNPSSSKQPSDQVQDHGIADPGSIELTNSEVLLLLPKLGFEVLTSSTDLRAPYIQDPDSMLQNTYSASFWVARKIEEGGNANYGHAQPRENGTQEGNHDHGIPPIIQEEDEEGTEQAPGGWV